ncbi:hypothetical protein CA236_13145 [Sphingomonas sp. ABOLG]|jgi:hypothetical protein|nr:hypothetical protein CA236_13145 [Sphingomonas sp. ABOLG]
MRLVALMSAALLAAVPADAQVAAPASGADRTYPAQWVPLLRKLSKADVDRMQAAANAFCRGLDYAAAGDLYKDVSGCTLMQATAIMSVDQALSDLDADPPTKYRPDQVKKCWALYRALGSKDAENLAHCFGDIQHFELLQRVAGSGAASAPVPRSSSSGYCDKVAQAAGGSYMILEECIKQENAARRRLGQ